VTHEPHSLRPLAPPAVLTTPPITASPFTMRFSSTSRGARLARHMTGNVLDAWGVPYDSEPHDALTLVVAELCANAVTHGRVPGRDFELRLSLTENDGPRTVTVEVTDTASERLPTPTSPLADAEDDLAESGRGLLLIAELTDTWGWRPRPDGPGKTVWAHCTLPEAAEPGPGSSSRLPKPTATPPDTRDPATSGAPHP
jgi:anti-sigma regulatory factor (Ser/Thr protein kinase)